MSVSVFEGLQEKINTSKVSNFFSGGKPRNLILEAEKVLGVKFPRSYVNYIEQYGSGGMFGFEIYGIPNRNLYDPGVPNAIWLTLEEREKQGLPHNLVLIMDGGLGDYYALNCEKFSDEGEVPVVIWNPVIKQPVKQLQKVANSFAEFFLMKIEEAITSSREEE